MILWVCKLFIALWLASCGEPSTAGPKLNPREYKDSCDNPNANINCCFSNMPNTISSQMIITQAGDSETQLRISGTIFKKQGNAPYPNVTIYAYHTDSKGYYSKNGKESGIQKWHGRLHGWCKTDEKGRYEIHTIKPAPYPNNTIPAHIHIAIKEPGGKKPFYISDIVFEGDSLVNQQYLSTISSMIGGTGIVKLTRAENGTWKGTRDIVLP